MSKLIRGSDDSCTCMLIVSQLLIFWLLSREARPPSLPRRCGHEFDCGGPIRALLGSTLTMGFRSACPPRLCGEGSRLWLVPTARPIVLGPEGVDRGHSPQNSGKAWDLGHHVP
eukprot:2314497-Amphidinium_carterae.4